MQNFWGHQKQLPQKVLHIETWRNRAQGPKCQFEYSATLCQKLRRIRAPLATARSGETCSLRSLWAGGGYHPPPHAFRWQKEKKVFVSRGVHAPLASPLARSAPPLTKTFFALPGNLPPTRSPPTGDILFFVPSRHSGSSR